MTAKTINSSVLETDRLQLRPMAEGDADFLFSHFGHPDVSRWLVDNDPPATKADAQDIVNFYTSGLETRNRWIIGLKQDRRPIGTVGFHLWEKPHRRAEIGYDLGSAFWRQGIGTEAVRAALQFGFEVMDLHRIEAYVHVENQASRRLLEGLGFVLEGTARENFLQAGKFHDHWCFALLEGELA